MEYSTLRNLFALSTVFSLSLARQGQEKQVRTLRILPLGDNPPFRQELADGKRVEVAPDPGAVPPTHVLLPGAASDSESKVRLRLNTVSNVIEVPAGDEPGKLALRDPEGTAWAEIPYTAGPKTLTLVWRGGKKWDEVRTLALPDQPLKDGECRFVNTTNSPIGIVWGNDRKKLSPGENAVLSITGDQVSLAVLYPTPSGEARPCLTTTVERAPTLSQQFFIYRADGEDIRIPVKVLPLREMR